MRTSGAMAGLRISPDLVLPLDAVTWTFAFLAMRRAGKSTAVVGMAEEMTKAGLHWIAVDPKGDWWGIRSSADGKHPGLAVPIFGGLHGDVSLTPASGALVAELLVREGVSALVDISEFTKNEQVQFLGGHGREDGFFARLYRLKSPDQPPTHLFLEEADEYLPQSVNASIAKLHNDGQRLSTKGGQRGLGASLVTQRPARLHNDVLTQTENLVAMRNAAPTERKQVRLWTDHYGQSREIVDSLPSLKDGEAWFVSPHRLEFVGRIRFRKRETFDSGKTPSVIVKGKRRPPTLADIDFPAIESAMAATEAEAKEKDPRELHRRISELTRELAGRPSATREIQVPVEVQVEVEVPVPMLTEDERVLLKDLLGEMGRAGQAIERLLARPSETIGAGRSGRKAEPAKASRRLPTQPERLETRPPPPPPRLVAAEIGDFRPSKPQQRILDALAWFESVSVAAPRRPPLAAVAGASSKSSGFEKNMSTLRTAGLIDYPGWGRTSLTEQGRALAEWPATPATTEALQHAIFAMVSKPQARLLRVLIEVYPEALPREELADRAEVSVVSSGFEKNVSTLKSFELIGYPSKGYVAALPILFLEHSLAS
jgi:hypothetical protein